MAGSKLGMLWAPLFVYLCMHSLDVCAQTNLVLNPGFEDHNGCPNGLSMIILCDNWSQPSSGTCDYFNTCGTSFGSPYHNPFGHQAPHGGQAMAGIWCYLGTDYREYVEGTLSTPLVANNTYDVSFYANLSGKGVNPGNNSHAAISNLGIYLSAIKIDSPNTTFHLSIVPQIENPYSNVLDDTVNWVKISGTYKASGGERYIIIGNFEPKSKTHVVTYPTNTNSYYFIDDVSVIGGGPKVTKDTVFLCTGQNITLRGSLPDSNGTWNNNNFSKDLQVNKPGKYWKVTVSNSDTIRDTFIVISGITLINLIDTISLCNSQKYTIKLPANGTKYTWSDFSHNDSFVVTKPGKYFVMGTKNGCTSSDTLIAKSNYDIIFHLGPDSILCKQKSINLDVSYVSQPLEWQDGSTNKIYIVTKPGIYTVTAKNACGTFSASIHVKNAITLDTLLVKKEFRFCVGHDHSINLPNDSNKYMWNGNDTNRTFVITTPGVYYLSASRFNCVVTDTFRVFYDSIIRLNLPKDTTLCHGQKLLIDLKSVNQDIKWQDNSTNKTYTINKAGLYKISSSNACGIFADSVNVKFEKCDCFLYMPTSFTPDNNGHNDSLKAIGNCHTTVYLLSIYNRWGECVFQTNDIYKGWDGKFKNEPCIDGVYLWMIDLKFENTNEELRKGTVTLLH